MENNESNSLEGIRTDISWIKKTLNDISSELRSFPLAIDAMNKRIDSNESSTQSVKDRLENHLVIANELTREHQLNTDFRKNSELLIKIGTWLVPGNVALSLIIALLIFFKDKL